jgi:DNA polymerase-3 subunit gamma/tau
MAESPDSATPAPAPDGAYRVLARKYRPQSFADLIGQEAMVRTLSNAFATNRIHQAYIFTGVRGVGKTTTARILARALNYETETIKTPTIAMPTLGVHCQAIIESRHVDVIEMDAASNTSIDNIREIIEAARYKPVSARTKVYIIDEVHMLSKAAFNGLLKTLEEPPPHVKFLFATTEIRKVPVTVLSRCQRFDLRRIEIPVMMDYLETIIAKEGVKVEEEALMLLARASEGSMRDALSLLDQAIAHGSGDVRAEEVRASLGLADRSRVIDLFEAVMSGEIARALMEFETQFNEGAEPLAILTDLGEFVHVVTRLKLVAEAARDPGLSETERQRGLAFAKQVPIRALTMAWQILLKGLGEVQAAARPRMAAEMVLVRLAYAAELPSPGDMLRDLRNGSLPGGQAPAAQNPPGGGGGAMAALPRLVAENAAPAPAPTMAVAAPEAGLAQPASLADLVALAREKRDIRLITALERHVRVVHFEPGKMDIVLLPQVEPDLPNRLHKVLMDWTGRRWMISVVSDLPSGALPRTLREEAEATEAETRLGVMALPAVQALLNRFPGTEIVEIRQPADTTDAPVEAEPLDQDSEITDDDL